MPAPVDWRDFFWKARYGMGFNDRVNYDLGGKGPGNHPGQDEDERQAMNSAYLFAKEHPLAAPIVQPGINFAESIPSVAGIPNPLFAPGNQIRAREEGARQAAMEGGGGMPTAPRGPGGIPTQVPHESSVVTDPNQITYPDFPGASSDVVPIHEDPRIHTPRTNAPVPVDSGAPSSTGYKFKIPTLPPTTGPQPDVLPQKPLVLTVPPTPGTTPKTTHIDQPKPPGPADQQHQNLLGSNLTPEENRIRNSNNFNMHDLFGGYYGGGGAGGMGNVGNIGGAI